MIFAHHSYNLSAFHNQILYDLHCNTLWYLWFGSKMVTDFVINSKNHDIMDIVIFIMIQFHKEIGYEFIAKSVIIFTTKLMNSTLTNIFENLIAIFDPFTIISIFILKFNVD